MQHPLRRRLALAPSVVGVSHPVFTTCPHCSDDIPDRSRDMDIVRANRGIPVSHWPAQCQCRFGGQGTQIIAVPAGKNPLSPDFLRESMCMLPVQQQCGNGQYRVFDISGHKVIRCTCVNLSEGEHNFLIVDRAARNVAPSLTHDGVSESCFPFVRPSNLTEDAKMDRAVCYGSSCGQSVVTVNWDQGACWCRGRFTGRLENRGARYEGILGERRCMDGVQNVPFVSYLTALNFHQRGGEETFEASMARANVALTVDECRMMEQ